MNIVPDREHGVIYRNTENLFSYNGWPSAAVLEDGTVLAVCSGHRLAHVCPFGKSLLFQSRDGGRTWSAPRIVNDTVLDDRDTGLLHLGGGKLLLSWFSHSAETFFNNPSYYYGAQWRSDSIQDIASAAIEAWREMDAAEIAGGSFVRLSADSGEQWGEKIQVPVTSPHGPAKKSDGSLLYVGNIFPRKEGGLGPLCAYQSTDGGRSWRKLCELPRPQEYAGLFCEAHCVELPNGEILVAARYQGPDADGAGSLFTIFTALSSDGGQSFSVLQPTGLCGSPPQLLVTQAGDIVMSYGRRSEPFGQRAVISRDAGRTWSEEYEIFSDAPDGDLGYPATVQLADGSLVSVYYQKCQKGELPALLYTKWRYV